MRTLPALRDIGFLYETQEAEIKVETFNFQKFGTLPAKVDTVATEAVDDPHRGLIYRVLLSSEKDFFIVEDRKIPLIPGMAVTAEIKTRQEFRLLIIVLGFEQFLI